MAGVYQQLEQSNYLAEGQIFNFKFTSCKQANQERFDLSARNPPDPH